MSLLVIGAGFGRTGTLSLKLALDRIGCGPCYHMKEVFEHEGHVALWEAARRGEQPWEALFAGYSSAVDWPASAYWKELAAYYPESKIILTHRDPERWYDSARSTIYRRRELPPDAPATLRAHRAMVTALVWDGIFDGRFEDRQHALAVFREHIEVVKRDIPPERLLVFEAKQGWQPLCGFLDRPVPDDPFPRVNTEEEFNKRFPELR